MRHPSKRQSAFRQALNLIFGTESGVRLLRVLTQDGSPMSRSELARRAGLHAKGASLAADRLMRMGVVQPIGAGSRQLVSLNHAHPLLAPITTLFECERARGDQVLAAIREAIKLQADLIDAAWVGGGFAAGTDLPGDAVSIAILAGSRNLERAAGELRRTLAATEAAHDISIDVRGVSRADISALAPKDKQWFLDARPVWGIPPWEIGAQKKGARMPSGPASHVEMDRQALALATHIADRISKDSGIVAEAKRYVAERLRTATPSERREWSDWKQILDMSPARLRAFLVDKGERATRLRQSMPFTNVMTQEERRRVLEQGLQDDSPAT